MEMIVYGDFNCPYSYLASQRVDALIRRDRAAIEWRAVEHEPGLSMIGTPSGISRDVWERDLAAAASLALPAERPAGGLPREVSNTMAAVSAYAEAVTDGIQDDVRRALFDAVWVRRRNISSAYEVRAVVTAITRPVAPILPFLSSELPLPGFGDPDPAHITRVLGGTIAPNGAPLTTVGWRRVGQWRAEWLALPPPVVPIVVDSAGVAHRGVEGLAYLGALLSGSQTSPAERVAPDARSAGVRGVRRPAGSGRESTVRRPLVAAAHG